MLSKGYRYQSTYPMFCIIGFRTDTIIYNQITPQLIVRKYKTKIVRNTSRKHVLYAKIVQSWSVLSLIESKLKKQSQVMQGKKTKSIVKERAFLHADAIYGFHSSPLQTKALGWEIKKQTEQPITFGAATAASSGNSQICCWSDGNTRPLRVPS